jgi:polyphosphate glucokinase
VVWFSGPLSGWSAKVIVLGIDIGGSGIKGAPVDLVGGRLATERLRLPTPDPATPKAIAETVAEIADHFAWQGPIGCGLPAAVRQGIVCTAANIDAEWIGTDVNALFQHVLGTTVTVLNDADAAGLAEMRFGAGQNQFGTLMVITIGTGLGTALFRDQVLFPNTELGHILLNGKKAEQFASGAVRKREHLSYETWAGRLDVYLKRLEELFWPDLFILGGGISKKHDKFFPYLSVKTRTVPAQLRNEAGIVGAALAAQNKL